MGPIFNEKVAKKRFIGLVNSAQDPLVWHKVWETRFLKKKKEERERERERNLNLDTKLPQPQLDLLTFPVNSAHCALFMDHKFHFLVTF